MLQVKNLVCARNDNILFSNVAFTLRAGEALQITGQNGIGKTTLLKTIAGLLRPSSGQVLIDNTADICYVGHKHGLHSDLTVLQNLQFMQALANQKNSVPQLKKFLEYFNIQHKMHSKCSTLSAGQCQQISLMRLFIIKAKIWLLDEPLANLDAAASALLNQLCVKHVNNGGIIVAATHNNLNLDTACLHLGK